jgi:hypothetical protein
MLAGIASDISQQVLRTDVAGMPLEWIDYREAVRLYHADQVAYDCGTLLYTVFGGYSSVDGERSKIDVNSIIATHGTSHSLSRNRDKYVPPLNNRTLFKRDANLCLYCAMRYPTRDLTRCNNYKGGRTPEQASMELIAIPFTPTYAEYIYLKGRRVLTDQMQYLLAHIPRSSPLHARLSDHLADGKEIVDVHFHE